MDLLIECGGYGVGADMEVVVGRWGGLGDVWARKEGWGRDGSCGGDDWRRWSEEKKMIFLKKIIILHFCKFKYVIHLPLYVW